MVFKLYSSQFSQATRSVALWVMAAASCLSASVCTCCATYSFLLAALFVFAGIVSYLGVRLFAALRIGRSHSPDNAGPTART